MESNEINSLKKEAEKENLTLAQICRRKLKNNSQIKLELIMDNINRKLNSLLEINGNK
ncbi:MAG: hypothetical protein Q8N88_04445 [Nanoarchaeota archaeon]|nr:hypothetical protein [Nanoarchaeota archaeon]